MKKYSDDYFEKKYKILFDKLLQKEGFVDDIKATRKELGLPANGFANGPELAFFFINKLTKDQQHSLTFSHFFVLMKTSIKCEFQTKTEKKS